MAERGTRKRQVGLVTSDKMDKTIVIEIEIVTRHPLYRKTIRRNKSLKAHDEANAAKVGDRVRVVETRPLSKEKRWRLVQILERAR